MPVPPTSNPQDTQAAVEFMIIFVLCLGVRYFGKAARVLLYVVIGLAIIGAFTGYDTVSHLLAAHHHQ